ncbi:unnamed protein product [Phytomonas sp. Hart1]|nr:unnamed protein product [Phytomonas sp. Hart1]|eukprot:CCW70982.1 unnamed protein product [Phytomonas sp. isolate Hart1]
MDSLSHGPPPLCSDIEDRFSTALRVLEMDLQQLADLHHVKTSDSPNPLGNDESECGTVENEEERPEDEAPSNPTSSVRQLIGRLQQGRVLRTIQQKKIAEEHPLRWQKVQSVKALLEKLRHQTGLELLDASDCIGLNGDAESDEAITIPFLDLSDDNTNVKSPTSLEWGIERKAQSGDSIEELKERLASAYRFQARHAKAVEQNARKMDALIHNLRRFFNDENDILASSSGSKANLVRLLETWPTHIVGSAEEKEAWKRWASNAASAESTKPDNANQTTPDNTNPPVKNLNDALCFSRANRSRFAHLMHRWKGVRARYETAVQQANNQMCFLTLRLDTLEEQLAKDQD